MCHRKLFQTQPRGLSKHRCASLRSGTIRLVQNGCSFYGLRSEDPNQHLKDFLRIVESLATNDKERENLHLRLFQFSLRDHASNWLERLPAGSITIWDGLTTSFLAEFIPPVQIFYDHVNRVTRQAINHAADGRLLDHIVEDSWKIIKDLALYDNECWNDPRDLAKPVKEISLP
ncbi:MAK10-like protein [Tanacetum coccineum]